MATEKINETNTIKQRSKTDLNMTSIPSFFSKLKSIFKVILSNQIHYAPCPNCKKMLNELQLSCPKCGAMIGWD